MLKEILENASRLNFTFLTKEQIWGDDNGNGQLDVIKKYGTKVAPTDLTVLFGSFMTASGDRTSEGDLTCVSWSASSLQREEVCCVNYDGTRYCIWPDIRTPSARPALPPSEASKISPSETRTINGVRVAEYGEYPQTVADRQMSVKLEDLFRSQSLATTGKNYTFDSVDLINADTPFRATTYPEYELDGKKYIRVLGRPSNRNNCLSTGEQVKEGKSYWVQVEPIEWLMDRGGTMVAKKCLFAGIQFDTNDEYDGDFSKTSMKSYLDTYFAKEIKPSENTADRERAKMLAGVKKKLAKIIDIEETKKSVTPAKTPERTDELVEIVRLRRASALLKPIAQKAQKEGDEKTLQAIVEMARQFQEPWMKLQKKVMAKGAARRAKNGRG